MAIIEGDVGTVIEVTATEGGSALDISSATGLQIVIEKPDGTIVTKTATLTNDGSDGKMQATSEAGDIAAGIHKTWGKFTLGTWTGHTQLGEFLANPKPA